MSKDYQFQYWKEAIEAALEDVNKLALFSDEELELMAKDIQNSVELKSMAFGEDCIPNPLQTEIKALKESAEKKERGFEFELSKQKKYYEEEIRSLTIKIHRLEDGR